MMLGPSSARSDGGGIRGLSELLILQEIMERIRVREGHEEAPLPCDYFDLIGGTGTGGWVVAITAMTDLTPACLLAS